MLTQIIPWALEKAIHAEACRISQTEDAMKTCLIKCISVLYISISIDISLVQHNDKHSANTNFEQIMVDFSIN